MGFIGSLEIRQIEKTCWIGEHFAQLNSYWTRFKSFFRFFGKICINKIFRIDSQTFSFHLLGSKKYSGGKIVVNTATDMMEIKPNIHIRSTLRLQ